MKNGVWHSIWAAPISLIYRHIVWWRNMLYDEHILPSTRVPVPTIGVGNLAVGGTGKTPMIEYLVRLLSPSYKVAVLSRGYGRKTRGFVMADRNSDASTIGDEMMQMHLKFPDIPMAVCANRVQGVKQLHLMHPEVQLVLLDDVFQHRSIHCDMYILLTPYERLYQHDHLLPWGRLREPASEALRAQVVVVTKCPDSMKPIDKRVVANHLRLAAFQSLFFSHIRYEPVNVPDKPLVVTGIAHADYLFDYIRSKAPEADQLIYPDHHNYSKKDIARIAATAEHYDAVITTEKDASRFGRLALPESLRAKMVSQAIYPDFREDEAEFNRKIKAFVAEQIRHAGL